MIFVAWGHYTEVFQENSSFIRGLLGALARTLAPDRDGTNVTAEEKEMLKRIAVFVYGIACYGVFFATFLYAIGFVGDLVVPKSMDSPARTPFLYALGIDVLLLGIFALQHSVMARPWFKRVWTRVVPEPAERSTYVLLSSLALIALFA